MYISVTCLAFRGAAREVHQRNFLTCCRAARDLTTAIKLKVAWDLGWRPAGQAKTTAPNAVNWQQRQEAMKQQSESWAEYCSQNQRKPSSHEVDKLIKFPCFESI